MGFKAVDVVLLVCAELLAQYVGAAAGGDQLAGQPDAAGEASGMAKRSSRREVCGPKVGGRPHPVPWASP